MSCWFNQKFAHLRFVIRKSPSVAARVAESPPSDIRRAAVREDRPYRNQRRVALSFQRGAAQEDGFAIDDQCRRLQ
jgi:hypothetical protein